MSARKPVLALVGATSAVGRDLIERLAERRVPLERLRLLVAEVDDRQLPDSPEGVPTTLDLVSKDAFGGVDFAVFCDDPDIARRYAPIAAEAGAIAVDLTGGTLDEAGVVLVAPGITPPSAIAGAGRRLALPPPAAGALAAILAPLHAAAGVKRVVVSIYEAAATAGQAGLDELFEQVRGLLGQQEAPAKTFPEQLAFNVIPRTGPFTPDGDTEPEVRVVETLRRLLGVPDLRVAVTAARVSAFHGTSASVNVEFERPITPAEARTRLAAAPGVEVVDDPAEGRYPIGLDAAGQDFVLVGRIRADHSVPSGLSLWLSADDIRRGGAVAAVDVIEAFQQSA
ncbi:MAG TPA: aspartate-semialdehyde dehydrogenase [Thermodesulfobacteriota bacterium]